MKGNSSTQCATCGIVSFRWELCELNFIYMKLISLYYREWSSPTARMFFLHFFAPTFIKLSSSSSFTIHQTAMHIGYCLSVYPLQLQCCDLCYCLPLHSFIIYNPAQLPHFYVYLSAWLEKPYLYSKRTTMV